MAAVALIVVVGTAPSFAVAPRAGLDPSWQAALQMARDQGLHWGSEVVFTYGPLGFLDTTRLYVPGLALSAILVGLLVHVIGAVRATQRTMRSMPWWGALPIVFVGYAAGAWRLLSKGQVSSVVVALVVATGLALVWRDGDDRHDLAIAIGLGMAVGWLALVKVNDAGVAGLAGGIAVLGAGLQRRSGMAARLPAAYVAAGITTFAVGWMLAGQALGDVLRYLTGALRIAAGFGEAMVKPVAGSDVLTFGAVVIAAVGAVAWAIRETRHRTGDWRVAVCVAAAVAIYLFGWFKQGFVRHDGTDFFALLTLLVLFAWGRERALATLLVAGGVVGALWLNGTPLGQPLDALTRIRAIDRTAQVVLSADTRSEIVASGRARVLDEHGLPDDVLAALDGGVSLHVDPSEVTVAWALGDRVDWRPPPVFQSYQAYTSSLDGDNAAFLRSQRAPRYILREDRRLDDKAPQFMSPAWVLEQVCRHQLVAGGAEWRLLAAGPDRCGEADRMRTVEAQAGAWVEVPDAGPGMLVTASIEPQGTAGALGALRSVLYAPRPATIQLDDQSYRFVRGHAEQPHVLAAPACAGAALDVPEQVDRIRLDEAATVTFARRPVAC